MYTDQWGELPEWCTPGTKTWIYSYKGAVRVTIKSVTRTQIRAVEKIRKDYEHVHTFERTADETRSARDYGQDGEPKFHERGTFSSYLVHPNFQPAILAGAEKRGRDAFVSAVNTDGVRKLWNNTDQGDRTPELAMELLDEMENRIRRARAEVEQWTKIKYNEGP